MAGLPKPQSILTKEATIRSLFDQLTSSDLDEQRFQAQQCFLENGLPTHKHEDWQFTPLTQLMLPTKLSDTTQQQSTDFSDFKINEHAEHILFIKIIDGHIQVSEALKSYLEPTALNTEPDASDDAMWLLNQAVLQNRVRLNLTESLNLWIHYSSTQPAFTSTQLDLHIAPSTEVNLIETHDKGADQALANHSLNIIQGANSGVKHYKWQNQSLLSQHFSHQNFQLAQDARLHSVTILRGGNISRQANQTHLLGKGASSSVNSLYVGQNNQILDSRTKTYHQAEHCQSVQVHKGVLKDKAKGVFQGLIYVDPVALGTDGQMDNRVLLLSDHAENNSKPQLEIYADDVKCSHGFTCGELDERQLFYMRARGIPEKIAKQYLIYAFAAEVAELIEHKAMREKIDQILFAQLN